MLDTSRIDLNLLATLEVLLAERNVTRAANRLHLSQPAVSAQLARLRDIFDDPLLVPAHRGMIATAKALELLEPLRLALDQLRGTLQSHRDFDPALASLTVRIASTDYVQAAVIMPLVLGLRIDAPGIRIASRVMNPTTFERQLAENDLDIVLTTPDPAQAHLRHRKLFTEAYVLIGRHDHPRMWSGMSAADLVQLDHVVVSLAGGGFMTPVDDALGALGLKRRVVMSAASFLFVPEIVANSDLVALVPRRLLHSQQERLKTVELPWLAEAFDIYMHWHERTHGHPGLSWIREKIAGVVGATG